MKRIRAGAASYYFNRLQAWMGRMNFAMILYLFAKESGIAWYIVVPVMLAGSALLAWFDSRYIVEAENTENIMRSPVWVKFLNEWSHFYQQTLGRKQQ